MVDEVRGETPEQILEVLSVRSRYIYCCNTHFPIISLLPPFFQISNNCVASESLAHEPRQAHRGPGASVSASGAFDRVQHAHEGCGGKGGSGKTPPDAGRGSHLHDAKGESLL